MVAYLAAALLALLAAAGLLHALRTPKSEAFAEPETATAAPGTRPLIGV